MKIFAIGDTHLSGTPPSKPMDVFGSNWANHWEKIKTDWQDKVGPNDLVLLAGDISWAMKLNDALNDLKEIIALPGRKAVIRGNHDYWWQTVTKMSKAVDGQITFLHNSFIAAGEWAVCGSRGWTCPEDPAFQPEDQPIFLRETERIRASLASAKQAGFYRILLMLHYPPLYAPAKAGGFTELFATYDVEICLYGHLHGEAISYAPDGLIGNTLCRLVSCDALDFKLKQVLEIPD